MAPSSYHLELARSLVESCGLKDAIYVCQNNQWGGVMAAIEQLYGSSPGRA